VDDLDTVVAEAAFRQSRVDVCAVSDEEDLGNFFVRFERELHARDHNPATVVAAHDIHCNSHR